MTDTALETYLESVDADAASVVRGLDHAIRAAYPDFQAAVKYRILMYALHGDFRTWVCAIDASRKRASLRFLYGVLLDDPRHVLRSGSSVLMTWDFALDDPVDATAVSAYVAEAVARYPEYKANQKEILEQTRSATRSGRRPRLTPS